MDPSDRESLNALLEAVVGAAYEVSNTLGKGFLEKVYERALLKELSLRAIPAKTQVSYPVIYKGQPAGDYIADLVVDDRLIVELKCTESLGDTHLAQCINYLRASGLHLALLINFQHARVEWRRVVLDF
jgi:GxxExxY protein